MLPELDPRWDWIYVGTVDNPDPYDPANYVPGMCKHLDQVPVESVTGDVVAKLCLTCDSQVTVMA